ncbi:hypothetical protein [Allocoleopsis sp.]|uniref:hypothetical protein n=1 Tax=Allocoleopsis sp. TaxID=3088169 RepID=UPI002FD0E8D4
MPTSLGFNPPGGAGYYEIYEEGEILPLMTWVFVPLRNGVVFKNQQYTYTVFQIPTEVGHPRIQIGDCWEINGDGFAGSQSDHRARLGFIPAKMVGTEGDIVEVTFCDTHQVQDDVIGIWLFALP